MRKHLSHRVPGEAAISYIAFVLAAIGLALLLFAADFMVRGAVGVAKSLGVTPLIIGLTVVAIGTSAPELVTTFAAALAGAPEMAIGNVVGSNNANMLLILGVAAIIRPVACSVHLIARDGVMVLAATALFVAIGLAGGFDWRTGAVLVLCLGGYLLLTYKIERAESSAEAMHVREVEDVGGIPERPLISLLFLIGGLVGIIVGAEVLVRGGVGIAETFGVSRTVIGLTLIALGTSLPELAIVVVASLRGHSDVALGNVLGSNIFNLLGITGSVALVTPLETPPEILAFDIWVLLGATILLLPLMLTESRISRGEGWLLAGIYVFYLAAQFDSVRAWIA